MSLIEDVLHPSVLASWHRLNRPLEGRCLFMYLDRRCLVTTGVGNLINSVRDAQRLPWRRPDGELASLEEVEAEWKFVKAQTARAQRGGGTFGAITKLRLTEADVDAMVRERIEISLHHVTRRWPSFATWPADAQFAVLSWAWAGGPLMSFPKMSAALLMRDFHAAAQEVLVKPNEGTLRDRNAMNRRMLEIAAKVEASGADASMLWYPNDPHNVEDDQPTRPEIDTYVEEPHRGGGAMAIEGIVDGLREGDD